MVVVVVPLVLVVKGKREHAPVEGVAQKVKRMLRRRVVVMVEEVVVVVVASVPKGRKNLPPMGKMWP